MEKELSRPREAVQCSPRSMKLPNSFNVVTVVLTVNFIHLISSCADEIVAADDAPKHYCGSALPEAIAAVCQGSSSIPQLTPRPRRTAGKILVKYKCYALTVMLMTQCP